MAERISRVRITNKRLCPRYDYRAGISIKSDLSEADDWSPAISQNLSRSGIYILHSRILVPEEPVSIKIPLFKTSEMMTIRGFVSWVGIDDMFEDSPFWVTAGIHFDRLKHSATKTIESALSDRKLLDGIPVKSVANKIDFVM